MHPTADTLLVIYFQRLGAQPLEFPAELMETYGDDLIQLVSTIESPALRAGARLYMLTSLLAHRQRLLDSNKVSRE